MFMGKKVLLFGKRKPSNTIMSSQVITVSLEYSFVSISVDIFFKLLHIYMYTIYFERHEINLEHVVHLDTNQRS